MTQVSLTHHAHLIVHLSSVRARALRRMPPGAERLLSISARGARRWVVGLRPSWRLRIRAVSVDSSAARRPRHCSRWP